MAREYSLRLENPPTGAGTSMLSEITDRVTGWRRSIRANGGPWLGTFRVYGNENDLVKWFNEYLFYTVKEMYGGSVTWKGIIWEMTYTHRGIARRRSLDDVSNAVWALYNDTSGNPQETSTTTQAQSIARYGRMEEILLMDNYPQAAAEQRRDKTLAERSWPWPRPVGSGATGDSYLDVTVAGFAFTANNKYVTATSTSTTNINAWISNIVSSDCEFISAGSIDTNTVQVINSLSIPTRAWDQLIELVELGGSGSAPWRIFIDVGADDTNLINYEAVSTTPRYYLRGGQIRDNAMRPVPQWLVQPGVVRDLDYPVRGKETGSWLADSADLYIQEVTASDRGISWSTEDLSEAEILAAVQDYQLMIKRMEDD